nr:hypothetical protein BgiMline_021584 [Biomphalaria glabrata]
MCRCDRKMHPAPHFSLFLSSIARLEPPALMLPPYPADPRVEDPLLTRTQLHCLRQDNQNKILTRSKFPPVTQTSDWGNAMGCQHTARKCQVMR